VDQGPAHRGRHRHDVEPLQFAKNETGRSRRRVATVRRAIVNLLRDGGTTRGHHELSLRLCSTLMRATNLELVGSRAGR